LLDALLGGIVILLAFLLAAYPARNGDVWIHLAAGKLLTQGKYHLGADPFAHTTAGVAWVNHAWLYDLVTYGVYQVADGVGLALFKALLIALLGGVLLRVSAAGRGLWVPALCSALALLAVGLRVPLQPMCVSFVALALTLGFLERGGRRYGQADLSAFAAYWPLFPLFALWANLDAWFLLGPLAVALYGLGSLLRGDRRSASALGLVLLAGLAACLVNPHHVRVFAWPNDLGLSPAAAALAADPLGRELVVSPLGAEFLQAGLALSPGGLAYLALALVGLISFAVNRGGRPWSRLLLWVALLALSLYQWRAIPFFAVVAGPIAALNFQEAALRREAAGHAAVLRSVVSLEVFTALIGVLVLGVAWPGWLQPEPYEPRRLAVEPEPSLQRAAAQVAAWRRNGLLGADALGLNFSLDGAHHFAFFCPEERGFLDSRLPLFPRDVAEDYAVLRQALLGLAEVPPEDWRGVLRRRHINHIIVYENETGRLHPALSLLYRHPEEWPLLYEDGRTVIFGWRDPERPQSSDAFAGLRLDLDWAAFHPADDKKAPKSWPGRPPRPPAWFDPFVKSRPARSLNRDEAAVYLLQFDTLALGAGFRHGQAFDGACAGGLVGAASLGTTGAALDLPLRLRLAGMFPTLPGPGQKGGPAPMDALAQHLLENSALAREDAPTGLLLLAVRAARRALHETPDDPTCYVILGEAYLRLTAHTSERAWTKAMPLLRRLRQVQASAAFNQALLIKPDHLLAHARLASLYGEMGYADLRLKHLKEVPKLSRAEGPHRGESAAQFEARLAPVEEEVKRLEEAVRRLTDVYEANAMYLKVIDRANAALEKGLAGKALDVLLGADFAAFDAPGMRRELELLLATGRVREVREWMDPEQKAVLGTTNFAFLQAQMKAATGDYDAADADLVEVADASKEMARGPFSGLTARTGIAVGTTALVLDGPLATRSLVEGLALAAQWRRTLIFSYSLAGILMQQGDVTVLRSLLALEAGETARAEALLREALALSGSDAAVASGAGLDFPTRPIARQVLGWLAPPHGVPPVTPRGASEPLP